MLSIFYSLKTLMLFRFIETRNVIRSLRKESRLKVYVIFAFAILLWLGLYKASFLSILWMKRQNPLVSGMAVEFGFNTFFSALSIMLVISNLLISYSAFFTAEESRFLNTLPIDKRAVFVAKFFDTFLFSSWSVLVLGFPLLFAFGKTHGAGLMFYLMCMLGMLLFILITGAVGVTLNLLFAAYFPRRHKGILIMSAGIIVVFIMVYIFRMSGEYKQMGMGRMLWLTDLPGRFSFLGNPFLPGAWMTRLIFASANQNIGKSLIYLFILSANTLFYFAVFYVSGIFLYQRGWNRVNSGASKKMVRGLIFNWLLKGKPQTVFLGKDLTAYKRDPAQWAQFLILFGLLLIYILNIRTIGYDMHSGFWRSIISSTNLFSLLMVMATLATRFYFPMISLEGKNFWLLGLSPISRRKILMTKYKFGFAVSLVISFLIVFLSNYMLKMPAIFFVIQGGICLFSSLALCGICIGLGAVFPEYSATSPSKIVGGFGGTFALIITSFYVIVISILNGVITFNISKFMIYAFEFNKIILSCAAMIIVLSVLAAIIPMRAGVRCLDRAEF